MCIAAAAAGGVAKRRCVSLVHGVPDGQAQLLEHCEELSSGHCDAEDPPLGDPPLLPPSVNRDAFEDDDGEKIGVTAAQASLADGRVRTPGNCSMPTCQGAPLVLPPLLLLLLPPLPRLLPPPPPPPPPQFEHPAC